MNMLSAVFRFVLLLTFGVAGINKLRDLAGTRRSLVEFGVPDRLSRSFALLLPITELLTAACLLPVATGKVGAVAALVLLLIFILGIGYNLAKGRKPDCNCFGQIGSAPIGRFTILRNVLLAAFALIVILRGPGLDFGSLALAVARASTPLGLAATGILLVLLVQLILNREIVQQQGRMLERLDRIETAIGSSAYKTAEQTALGLSVGSPAPEFSAEALNGEPTTLASLTASRSPVMLLFMNPQCGPCNALSNEAAEWAQLRPAGLEVVIVSEGTAEDNRAKLADFSPASVVLQKEREVADAYQAWGTPSAVLVAANGVIASAVAQGADAIRALLFEAVAANGGHHVP